MWETRRRATIPSDLHLSPDGALSVPMVLRPVGRRKTTVVAALMPSPAHQRSPHGWCVGRHTTCESVSIIGATFVRAIEVGFSVVQGNTAEQLEGLRDRMASMATWQGMKHDMLALPCIGVADSVVSR